MLRLSKKNIVFFITLFVLVLSCAFFHHHIICFGAKSILRMHMPNKSGIHFDYEKSRWQKGTFILQNVTFSQKSKLKKPLLHMKAEDVRLSLEMLSFPFDFTTNIEINRPQIELKSSIQGNKKKNKNYYDLLNSVLFKAHMKINQGELTINAENKVTCFLNFECGTGIEKKGFLEISTDVGNPILSQIRTQFSKGGDEIEISTLLTGVDLGWVSQAYSNFSSKPFSDWSVKKGNVKGDLTFKIARRNRIAEVRYALEIEDFALVNQNYEIDFCGKLATWKEDYLPRKMEFHPVFEKIPSYLMGKGELQEATFFFKDQRGEKEWAQLLLDGKVDFTPQPDPAAHFHGIYKKGEEEYPFSLTGKGETGKISIDLSMEQKGGEKMESFFLISSLGGQTYSFQTDWKNLGPIQFELAHRLISREVRAFTPYHFNKGICEGTLHGKMESKKLSRLEIDHFITRDFILTSDETGLSCEGEILEGKGEFDLSSGSFIDGTFWEMKLSKGNLSFGEQFVIKNFSYEISMHDQYIRPSYFSGSISDIATTLQFEGLYHHLNTNLGLSISPNDLLSLLGQERKFQNVMDEKISIELAAKIINSDTRCKVEGLTKINNETIEFGSDLSPTLFFKKGVLEDLIEDPLFKCWFKSLSISHDIFNLPLGCLDKEIKGEGDIYLEGNVTRFGVDVKLDPKQTQFYSPHISFIPAKDFSNQDQFCTFHYDFHEKKWSGKIPLYKSKLKENFFGIEFDQFSGEIIIQNEQIHIHNLEANADGVQFFGEIDLNLEKNKFSKLEITTDRIEGDYRNVQAFLRHFKHFSTLDLPVMGKIISGSGGMTLKANIGSHPKLEEWIVSMQFMDGSYSYSEEMVCKDILAELSWIHSKQILEISHVSGEILLAADQESKSYSLNIPLIQLDRLNGKWDYDIRVEASTHDIIHVKGAAEKRGSMIELLFDRDHTHFFGAKIDFDRFALGEKGDIKKINLSLMLSSLDLYHHLELFTSAGLFPLKKTALLDVQGSLFEGDVKIHLDFDKDSNDFSIDAKSDHFGLGRWTFDHLDLHIKKEKEHFNIDHFQSDQLAFSAKLKKEGKDWKIPEYSIIWNNSEMRGKGGSYHIEKKELSLPFDLMKVNLEQATKYLPNPREDDLSYLCGDFISNGFMTLDFENWILKGEIKIFSENFGKSKLNLESKEIISFQYDEQQGFQVANVDLHFFHLKSNQHWAKCHFDSCLYDVKKREWEGKNIHICLPPEMIALLGKTGTLPKIGYEDGNLIICNQQVVWDNQIELQFDFNIGDTTRMNGKLKEGYYWIKDKSWFLSESTFVIENETCAFSLQTSYEEFPFTVEGHIAFSPRLAARISIQEPIVDKQMNYPPLVIQTDSSEQEGFFIQSLEGRLCGLDFSFYHNPKDSCLTQMVLTGQVKIDVPILSRILPPSLRVAIQEFGIGKGYKLSGDLTLNKIDFGNSHFKGFLKGRHFELMGTEMSTLMSEISIHPKHIELSEFNISDQSGIFQLNEMRFEHLPSKKWHVAIPALSIQDFRPSLLKKTGKYRGRIKPLMIKNLSFLNIEGEIGNPKSFTGKGKMQFINTFKRNYNLLDIPIEILGRLGLDTALLVPIRGKLEYVISDGKIHFTELSHSYSEGKRSHFYLSPFEPSFIDFEGNLNIRIKMKQHVLLKVTEPFTLSIAGTFNKPKYGLK